MLDPIATAYAAPKAESAVALSRDERERIMALRLAVGFLLGTEVIAIGMWLVRALPWMWGTTDGLLGVLVWQLFPRIANGLSAVWLLRGRRGIVWLPIAIGALKEFAPVLYGAAAAIPLQMTIGFAILVLYAGILLVLVWKRSGRRRFTAAVVGIAAYLVLVVVEWFNPIIVDVEHSGP